MKLISKKFITYFTLPALVIYSLAIAINYFFYDLNWEKSGVIGDTIGGITSPLVNLLAAFLVYISFEEQRKSNEYQVKQLQISREDSLVTHYLVVYSQIKDSLKSIEIEQNMATVLMEFEILITAIRTTIKEDNQSKQFLLNLLTSKIMELEKFSFRMSEEDIKKFNYLNKIVKNEQ